MPYTNLGDNSPPNINNGTGVADVNITSTFSVYNASSAADCCAACASNTDPTLVTKATSAEVAAWNYTGADVDTSLACHRI